MGVWNGYDCPAQCLLLTLGMDSQTGKALHNLNDFSQKLMVLITASHSLIWPRMQEDPESGLGHPETMMLLSCSKWTFLKNRTVWLRKALVLVCTQFKLCQVMIALQMTCSSHFQLPFLYHPCGTAGQNPELCNQVQTNQVQLRNASEFWCIYTPPPSLLIYLLFSLCGPGFHLKLLSSSDPSASVFWVARNTYLAASPYYRSFTSITTCLS